MLVVLSSSFILLLQSGVGLLVYYPLYHILNICAMAQMQNISCVWIWQEGVCVIWEVWI